MGARRILAAGAFVLGAAACVAELPAFVGRATDAGDGGDPSLGVQVTLSGAPEIVRPGGSLTVTATLVRTGFEGPVTVALANDPAFSPATATIPAGEASGTITLQAKPDAKQGTELLSFDIRPEGRGAFVATLSVQIGGRPGELDETFGERGMVVLPGRGSLHDLVIDREGAMYAVGDVEGPAGIRSMTAVKIVAESVTSFEIGTKDISDASAGLRTAGIVDGRLVAGGYVARSFDAGVVPDAILLAPFGDGGRDPTFGDDGGCTIDSSNPLDGKRRSHEDLVVLGGARIVAAGVGGGGAGYRVYDGGGATISPHRPIADAGDGFANPTGIAAMNDNEVVVVGTTAIGALLRRIDPALHRVDVLPTPELTPTTQLFDVIAESNTLFLGGEDTATRAAVVVRRPASGAAVILPATALSRVRALARDAQGRLLAAGSSASSWFGLIRFSADGTIDGTFSSSELPRTLGDGGDTTNAQWEAIVVQKNGRLLVVGETGATGAAAGDFVGGRVIARYWD